MGDRTVVRFMVRRNDVHEAFVSLHITDDADTRGFRDGLLYLPDEPRAFGRFVGVVTLASFDSAAVHIVETEAGDRFVGLRRDMVDGYCGWVAKAGVKVELYGPDGEFDLIILTYDALANEEHQMWFVDVLMRHGYHSQADQMSPRAASRFTFNVVPPVE